MTSIFDAQKCDLYSGTYGSTSTITLYTQGALVLKCGLMVLNKVNPGCRRKRRRVAHAQNESESHATIGERHRVDLYWILSAHLSTITTEEQDGIPYSSNKGHY